MSKFIRIEKEECRELLDKVQFKTFFHELEFHEFLEKKFKWLHFEYYLYGSASSDASQGGKEAILVFGQIGKKMISLPFCEYGGPLLLKESFDWEQFERNVKEYFKKNIKIKFHPYILNISHASDISTIFIENLKNTSEQEIWNSLRKTLRHEIRHAQDRGLVIRECKTLKENKKFYNLYVVNLRRKKTVPYTWSFIQFLCQNPSNELLAVFYGGRIIGGALFLRYDNISHYFLSATDYKYHNFGIAHLILWEKIRSLINKDVVLDLGASPKGSALEIFKSGWGGTKYPIYQINLSADGREIKRTEESFRSSRLIRFIWSLLPNFLIKFLSKYFIKYRI